MLKVLLNGWGLGEDSRMQLARILIAYLIL